MKIKHGNDSVIRAIKSIADNGLNTLSTVLTMDVNGDVVVDGFTKFLDFKDDKISFETKGRYISVCGNDLKVVACRKDNIIISGNVIKIEMLEVK